MPKALTKEEFKERLFKAVGNKYSLKDDEFPYKNKYSTLIFHCKLYTVVVQRQLKTYRQSLY